ncbi:FxLD family lanthipeptide [Longispora sp. NPDC051575]|uniref:FxLD family lanthipeptide n=1 Tax=Longispora sp. NPDC051575 TaxID=3154943 RepID=UPI00343A1F64
MAPPTALLDRPEVDALTDEDFVLDMRVIERATPLAEMMCTTGDGCGSTCAKSACVTGSYDPA